MFRLSCLLDALPSPKPSRHWLKKKPPFSRPLQQMSHFILLTLLFLPSFFACFPAPAERSPVSHPINTPDKSSRSLGTPPSRHPFCSLGGWGGVVNDGRRLERGLAPPVMEVLAESLVQKRKAEIVRLSGPSVENGLA